MKYKIDLTGKRFGKQVALKRIIKNGETFWEVLCECGLKRIVHQGNLTRNKSRSCRKCMPKTKVKYPGYSGSNPHYLYRLLSDIKTRCYNKNSVPYKNYGGRGIKVHLEWHEFLHFKNYVEIELGKRPNGYSFDRIDNDGNYEPGNVRWATQKTQARNTRNTYKILRISCNGEVKNYPNLASVSDDGFSRQHVRSCVHGIRRFHKKYSWAKEKTNKILSKPIHHSALILDV